MGLAPACVLVLVALWEIGAVGCTGRDVPNDEDWQQAGAFVRSHHQRGDLIVVVPGWLDPIVRLHLGDLIPIEMAARMDSARYGRIWELSARGGRYPATRGLSAVLNKEFGPLSVRFYERDPVRVVSDFVALVAQARVEGRSAGRVQASLEEVGFAPRRCVRAVPQPGARVTVRYSGVALGAKLVGYVGLADVFKRRDVLQPGRFVVRVSGTVVADLTVGNRDGWVRFEAATQSGPADVEFETSATARDRVLCFAAEARQ